MKFRAKMVETMFMRQFSSVAATLSKLAKSCVLRISEDKMCFIIAEENAVPHRTMAWCVLQQSHFFNEYMLVGAPETNEIFLQFCPDMLASSLSSLRNTSGATSVKIKLTDKLSPCLTLEIESPSQLANCRLCVHDVPVTVIPRREWSDYEEPEMPRFDLSIEMPELKLLHNVVDRLKKLSNFTAVSGTGGGQFTLKVETSTAAVSTQFKDLPVLHFTGDGMKEARTRVDIRKLSQFLGCEQINAKTVVANFVSGRLLHCHLKDDCLELNYFLMAVDE